VSPQRRQLLRERLREIVRLTGHDMRIVVASLRTQARRSGQTLWDVIDEEYGRAMSTSTVT